LLFVGWIFGGAVAILFSVFWQIFAALKSASKLQSTSHGATSKPTII
jgi:hypothetical protein